MKASWLLLRVGGGPLVVAVLMAFPPPLFAAGTLIVEILRL